MRTIIKVLFIFITLKTLEYASNSIDIQSYSTYIIP